MKRFYILDLIRTFLAIVVMLAHYFKVFPNGGLAVDFFFILSGFILSFKYLETSDFASFVIDRISRIFPLFLVSILLCILIELLLDQNLANYIYDLFAQITLLNSLGFTQNFGLNYPSWSAGVELWLNILLLFPFFVFIKKNKMMLGVIFLLNMFLYIFIFRSSNSFVHLHSQPLYFTNFAVVRCISGLLLGFFTYKAYYCCKNLVINKALLFILQILSLIIFIKLLTSNGFDAARIFILLSPFFIIIFCYDSALNKLLGKFIPAIGGISYPIYLFHVPILRISSIFFDNNDALIAALMFTIELSIPIFFFIEKPLIVNCKKLLYKAQTSRSDKIVVNLNS